MLPRLALAYGPVPAGWVPRKTDAGMVAICEKCRTEYLDDFPYGGILLAPCCIGYMKRYYRAVKPEDVCESPTSAATQIT